MAKTKKASNKAHKMTAKEVYLHAIAMTKKKGGSSGGSGAGVKKPSIRKPRQPVSELQKKVMRANRILNNARKRLEEGGKYGNELMARSLHFAELEIQKIYGEGAEGFSIKGMTEEQLQRIEKAVDDILSRKTLTVKGQQEMKRNSLEGFYGKPYEEITAKERRMFDMLLSSGILDKVKEIAFVHTSMLNAAEMIAPEMSAKKTVEAISDWVNNVDGAREGAGNGEVTGNFYDYIHEKYIKELEARQIREQKKQERAERRSNMV